MNFTSLLIRVYEVKLINYSYFYKVFQDFEDQILYILIVQVH